MNKRNSPLVAWLTLGRPDELTENDRNRRTHPSTEHPIRQTAHFLINSQVSLVRSDIDIAIEGGKRKRSLRAALCKMVK